MNYLSKHQPRRIDRLPTGEYLQYRTHISRPDYQFFMNSKSAAQAQTALYRWAHGPDFVEHVSISELYDFILFDYQDEVSKRVMGAAVLQALRYDPRKLKGKTKDNPKACAAYFIRHREELIYGLEWQILLWMPRAVGDANWENAENLLKEVVASDEGDLQSIIDMVPTEQVQYPELDWDKVWTSLGLTNQPEIVKKRPLRVRPTSLRSVSDGTKV